MRPSVLQVNSMRVSRSLVSPASNGYWRERPRGAIAQARRPRVAGPGPAEGGSCGGCGSA